MQIEKFIPEPIKVFVKKIVAVYYRILVHPQSLGFEFLGIRPNQISWLRTVLLLPAVAILYNGVRSVDQGSVILGTLLLIECLILDSTDGYHARRLNMETKYGADLDRCLDKLGVIMILWIFMAFPLFKPLESWKFFSSAVILCIVEMCGLLLNLVTIILESYFSDLVWVDDNRSRLPGKLKMVIEALTFIFIFLLGLAPWGLTDTPDNIIGLSLAVCVPLSAISTIGHFRNIHWK